MASNTDVLAPLQIELKIYMYDVMVCAQNMTSNKDLFKSFSTRTCKIPDRCDVVRSARCFKQIPLF